MERKSPGNSASSSGSSADGGRRVSRRYSQPQPNYASPGVWEALEHLASIHPKELCHEAKLEHCRATRDLSGCGRYVQHVLTSCGHASLCAECSQRCEVCPICRTAIIVGKGDQRRLRLYNKCIEVGLISKQHDDRFQERQHDREHVFADVQRLYRMFDVALENSLVSLVCHYITDVCLDEGALSSDPMLSLLMGASVVKDWCRQKFEVIISDLSKLYAVKEELEIELASISKYGYLLTGLSSVLEVLILPSVHAPPNQLEELHFMLDNVLKAKQHLEIMTWCIKHNFLENVKPRYPDFIPWSMEVQQRKSAAVKRAWPDTRNSLHHDASTLFIEDALENLRFEQGWEGRTGYLDVSCLAEDQSASSVPISMSNLGGFLGIYPFKSLRAAADMLFLRGSAEMVVAKQAILLYYLFDRHWAVDESELWHFIGDFASVFGIIRHSVLESLLFYLLDDHTQHAMQEAAHLLPQVVGPETHPKIAQVLLQRLRPDLALIVLRCSGKDGFSAYTNSKHENALPVSLGEAVTAIRVRVECGLLTAAFMYLRMHCTKAKQEEMKNETHIAALHKPGADAYSWIYRVQVLVEELCTLCIWRNLVDRMIELPWNSDEEKFLCKCLYNDACQNPSSISASMLVVFFLQRYRYIEAYQFDRKLREIEGHFSGDHEVESRMRQISQWRAGLVDRSVELLPEIQRMQIKAAKSDDVDDVFNLITGDSPSKIVSGGKFSCNMGTSPSLEQPFVLQPTRSSLSTQEAPAKVPCKAASPTRTSVEVQSPGVSSPVGDIIPDSYGSTITNYKIASSMNGDISINPCNGDYSLSRGISTRGRLDHERKKALPRRRPASRKQTLFSTPNDVNMVTANSSFADGVPDQFNTRGMRWRNDESSEEEMEMETESNSIVREGSMLSFKRR